MRGYFGIGIWQPQHDCNMGTLFRSALAFGANYVFTIGRKYRRQASDTPNTPQHLPVYRFLTLDDFLHHLPLQSRLVCVETEGANVRDLGVFTHPPQAVYLLGSEGQTLPKKLLDKHLTVRIPSRQCLNVATAGSIVLFDRIRQMGLK